jgi:hypothetical protein
LTSQEFDALKILFESGFPVERNRKHSLDAETPVLIDVGLSTCAPQSERWLATFPDCLVIGFEPVPESFASSIKYVRSLPCSLHDRFFAVNCALGDSNGPSQIKMYVT